MKSIIWLSFSLLVSTTTMAQPGGPMPDGPPISNLHALLLHPIGIRRHILPRV